MTEGFYEGGLAAADGLVAGLEAKKGDVQKAIMDMASAMETALKSALGIASPSRRFRALMKFVGDGAVLGLGDQVGAVADASARLFDGVRVPGGSGVYGAVGSGSGGAGDITASLSDAQVERLAVAFETGNIRNINAATAQQNRKVAAVYGAKRRSRDSRQGQCPRHSRSSAPCTRGRCRLPTRCRASDAPSRRRS